MKLLPTLVFSSLVALSLFIGFIYTESTGSEYCNETVCGSIVSKCQLMKRCNCDANVVNVTCTQDCFKCLDYLYIECCACVDVCPKVNSTAELLLSSQSHVEDLPEPLPFLFTTITEEDDPLQRWTLETFPVRMSFVTASGQGEVTTSHHHPYISKITNGDGFDRQEDLTVNCTVVFMSDCMPYNKCKSSCTSMGASAYRWFHDGCCECVGPHCINYGMNESKCLLCPLAHHSKEDGLMHVDIAKTIDSSSTSKSDGQKQSSTGSNPTSTKEENKVASHHSTLPSGSSDILDYEISPSEPEEAETISKEGKRNNNNDKEKISAEVP